MDYIHDDEFPYSPSQINEYAAANDLENLRKVISLANMKESYWVMWWAGYHCNMEMVELCIDETVNGSCFIIDTLTGLLNTTTFDIDFMTKILWMHKDSLQKSGFVYQILPKQLDLLKKNSYIYTFIQTFNFDPKLKPMVKEIPESRITPESIEEDADEIETYKEIYMYGVVNNVKGIKEFIAANKTRKKQDFLTIMYWSGFHCNREMAEICLENDYYRIIYAFEAMANRSDFDESLALDLLYYTCKIIKYGYLNKEDQNMILTAKNIFSSKTIEYIKEKCIISENILYEFLMGFKYTGQESIYSPHAMRVVEEIIKNS
jgi:hypothetical protein